MPANPLSAAFNWLATHLVALCLLGFVVSGLMVSGLIGGGPPVARDRPTAGSASDPDPVDAGVGRVDVDPAETAPRLIGGSLPVYGQAAPGGPRPPSEDSADGFRPPASVPLPEPARLTREDHLQRARRAYWNGEFEQAEAAYMDMIEAFPGDADAFGELGNVYQSMGKQERALDAYYEAAVRLHAAGEKARLRPLGEFFARQGDSRLDQLTH